MHALMVSSGYNAVSDSTHPTLTKIRGFLSLQRGWHHGEGIPPVRPTVEKAIKISQLATHELLSTDAVPGIDGEIQIAIYQDRIHPDRYIEVTIAPGTESINITRYDYDKKNTRWQITEDQEISLNDVGSVVRQFGREVYQWRSSYGYSQKSTTFETLDDLAAWPFVSMGTEYQSYTSHAS